MASNFSQWLLEELYIAYIGARCAKRKTSDEHRFEINQFENLAQLRDDILSRNYRPSRGIAFITHKPVTREIFAAPFRDRIVHHLLFNNCYDWWDKRLIYDSYSCRLNKGTLFGVKRLARYIQQVSNNYQDETYVIKLDIQGYFMSLPRKDLFQRILWGLNQQFPEHNELYHTLKYLWQEIIFDDPIRDVRRRGKISDWDDLPPSKSLFCQPPGQGIVIGNLSSQLLSNIYLDLLDRYVTHDLGYKAYGRYVDDFYIIVPAADFPQALRDVRAIESFLSGIGLTLHPRKRYIQNINHGVEFLGTVVYPGYIVPGKRIKRNFYQAYQKFQMDLVDTSTIVSYLGHLDHINSRKFVDEILLGESRD